MFAYDLRESSARTATIIVDYNTLSTERYQVATDKDPKTLRVTAKVAMTDILNIPFGIDETGALDSVRDLASSADTSGHWVALLKTSDGEVDTMVHYSQDRDAYDFANIELKSGDVLHLIYLEGINGDGLGRRLEALCRIS